MIEHIITHAGVTSWEVREYEWCLIHERALDEGHCLACMAEKPNP